MGENKPLNPFLPEELELLLSEARRIARHAGKILMDHYNRHENGNGHLQVEIKDDNSPVTQADKDSHDFITYSLQSMTPSIPVISEENAAQPEIPDNGRFWTVDPLDGTKGFIRKNDQFFVKIALMDGFEPVLGIVYQPATEQLYFSVKGGKSYCQDWRGKNTEMKTRKAPQKGELSTLFNDLFYSENAYDAARKKLTRDGLAVPELRNAKGTCSTAFNMAVAKGLADAFICCGQDTSLRNGNGYSWDYAPDWLILKNAGGVILTIHSGKEARFDRPTSRMDAMISLGDKELGKKTFPNYENDCV